MITSRGRVRLVINHKKPDRIPIDMGSNLCTGISAIAYNRLRKMLNINSTQPKMYDFMQQLSYPEEKVMEAFNIDVINAGRAFLNSNNDWLEWILDDGSKCFIPRYLNIEIDKNSTDLLEK